MFGFGVDAEAAAAAALGFAADAGRGDGVAASADDGFFFGFGLATPNTIPQLLHWTVVSFWVQKSSAPVPQLGHWILAGVPGVGVVGVLAMLRWETSRRGKACAGRRRGGRR